VREAVGEAGPAVDVEQDIRDLGARQQPVGGILQLLGLGWRIRLPRRDHQLVAGEVDTVQLALIGELSDILGLVVERCTPPCEIALHVGVDGDGQRPLGFE